MNNNNTNIRDHYLILGVSRNADKAEIRHAYMTQAKKWHPDKVPPEEKERAGKLFAAIATSYSILSDSEKRKEYTRALLEQERSLIPSNVSTVATYNPQPGRASSPGMGYRRSSSPGFGGGGGGMRSPSPNKYGSGYPSAYSNGYSGGGGGYNGGGGGGGSYYSTFQEPSIDPYALFNTILNSQQAHISQSHNQPFNFFETPTEQRRSRIGNKGDLFDHLDGVLDRNDPLRREVPQNLFRDPPEPLVGKDPWGRKFDGEVLPAGGGRGRRLSTSLREGERHRNGDYKIRQQSHNAEQLADGSIKWSSHSVEISYYSNDGAPQQQQQQRSSSHHRSSPYTNNHEVPPPYQQQSRPQQSLYRSSSQSQLQNTDPFSQPRIQSSPYSAYQTPNYPSLEYSKPQSTMFPPLEYSKPQQAALEYPSTRRSAFDTNTSNSDLIKMANAYQGQQQQSSLGRRPSLGALGQGFPQRTILPNLGTPLVDPVGSMALVRSGSRIGGR